MMSEQWAFLFIMSDIVSGYSMQLDEHFSRPMKEFVSLCLRKVPAEVIIIFSDHFLQP